MRSRISSAGTTFSRLHSPCASSGMNSMKRMPTPLSRPKRARSTTSSSLTPRITTAFTFTGERPASIAASMPAITRGSSSRLVEREERGAVERVERHVDPLQPGLHQIVRGLAQLHAVRRHRDVDVERCELGDQPGDVRADERLAAGEAHRVEPEPLDAHAGDPGDLLVGEELGLREPVHALGRHAVGAPEVATVGDRDPQILDAARERIDEGNRHPVTRHRARLRPGEEA